MAKRDVRVAGAARPRAGLNTSGMTSGAAQCATHAANGTCARARGRGVCGGGAAGMARRLQGAAGHTTLQCCRARGAGSTSGAAATAAPPQCPPAPSGSQDPASARWPPRPRTAGAAPGARERIAFVPLYTGVNSCQQIEQKPGGEQRQAGRQAHAPVPGVAAGASPAMAAAALRAAGGGSQPTARTATPHHTTPPRPHHATPRQSALAGICPRRQQHIHHATRSRTTPVLIYL